MKSENMCWETAKEYFENLLWKNPDSLTIHDHTSTIDEYSYIFTIDYSAQNGFGGYNRETAIIVVNGVTNQVTSAFVH